LIVNIRHFVKSVDEPVWVAVLNASRKDRDEWRAITAEEMLRAEEGDPGYDLEGRFIAELDGRPVGVVHAHVDRFRDESKGFVRLDVRPELRSQGIERQLLDTALTELKARGMTIAQASADSSQQDYMELLKGSGFSQVRVGSTMEMGLANVAYNIGENTQVAIRPLQQEGKRTWNSITGSLTRPSRSTSTSVRTQWRRYATSCPRIYTTTTRMSSSPSSMVKQSATLVSV
jgi:GNAT superfamily N-acetyltransferase